jgi:hypothetical protein
MIENSNTETKKPIATNQENQLNKASLVIYSFLTVMNMITFFACNLKQKYEDFEIDESAIMWPISFILSLSGMVYFTKESFFKAAAQVLPIVNQVVENAGNSPKTDTDVNIYTNTEVDFDSVYEYTSDNLI